MTEGCTGCSATSSLMLLTTLALIVVTGYLYMIIPKGFFPQQDTGFIFGEVDTRQDASFAATSRAAAGDRRYLSNRTRRWPSVFSARRRVLLQPDRKHRPRVHPVEAVQ